MFFMIGILTITRPSAENTNLLTDIISSVAAVLIECLIVLPAVFYSERYNTSDPVRGIFETNTVVGKILCVFYAAFFIYAAINSLGAFSFFLTSNFPELSQSWVVILLMCAVSLYASCLGIEALTRSSVFVGAIFAALVFIVTISVTGEYDVDNLQLMFPFSENLPGDIFKETLLKLGRSSEICALPFLICHVDKNKKTSVFYFLAVKLGFTILVLLAVKAVLGGYSQKIFDPFYTLSTYARISVIERFDAIYGFVWTLGAFVKISVLFYLGGMFIGYIFPGMKNSASVSIATAVSFAVAVFIVSNNMWDNAFLRSAHWTAVVFLGGIVPIVALLLKSFKTRKRSFDK